MSQPTIMLLPHPSEATLGARFGAVDEGWRARGEVCRPLEGREGSGACALVNNVKPVRD